MIEYYMIFCRSHDSLVEMAESFTTLLTISHASLTPFLVYMAVYQPFRILSIEKYLSRPQRLYQRYHR